MPEILMLVFLKRGLVMFFSENVGDFGHPMNLAIIPIIDIVVWFVTLKRELQCIKQQCHSSAGPLGLAAGSCGPLICRGS